MLSHLVIAFLVLFYPKVFPILYLSVCLLVHGICQHIYTHKYYVYVYITYLINNIGARIGKMTKMCFHVKDAKEEEEEEVQHEK